MSDETLRVIPEPSSISQKDKSRLKVNKQFILKNKKTSKTSEKQMLRKSTRPKSQIKSSARKS